MKTTVSRADACALAWEESAFLNTALQSDLAPFGGAASPKVGTGPIEGRGP